MKILVTGGLGFIGTNVCSYFGRNNKIFIVDNFARRGSLINAAFLEKNFPKIEIAKLDVRSSNEIATLVKKSDVVIHLAGQVAVTSSIVNPREDFEINMVGTFNILEAARASTHKPLILYSSTNKVYGEFRDNVVKKEKRYVFRKGIKSVSELKNLDFYSPYGCSKGAADQYVRDYARVFNVPTIVFRQSCIYGPHQFGIEDQGWVAHFLIKAILRKKITVYGTGLQVRDILYVDDLVSLYNRAIQNVSKVKGEVFNIGGGLKNTISLLELIERIELMVGKKIAIKFEKKRLADQNIFIADVNKVKQMLSWEPKVTIDKGLNNLYLWINENREIIKRVI